MKLRVRLVDDWRDFAKWASIRFSSLGLVLSAVGFGLSLSMSAAQLASLVQPWVVFLAGLMIFLATAIGRVLMKDDGDKS